MGSCGMKKKGSLGDGLLFMAVVGELRARRLGPTFTASSTLDWPVGGKRKKVADWDGGVSCRSLLSITTYNRPLFLLLGASRVIACLLVPCMM